MYRAGLSYKFMRNRYRRFVLMFHLAFRSSAHNHPLQIADQIFSRCRACVPLVRRERQSDGGCILLDITDTRQPLLHYRHRKLCIVVDRYDFNCYAKLIEETEVVWACLLSFRGRVG